MRKINSSLYKSSNSVKTKHITLRLKNLSVCAFSVHILFPVEL